MNRFYFSRRLSFGIFLAVFIGFNFSAQVINNLVVFCDDGEPFTLILNGARQNETPQTRVRVEGLTLSKYKVRIIFKNKKMKDDTPVLTFYSTCWECEFALNKHGSKRHTMDFFTQKKMEGCGELDNSQTNNPTDNTINTTHGNYSGSSTGTLTNQNTTPINTNNISTVNNCLNAIGNDEFNVLKNALLKINTDGDKQITANSLLQSHCLSTLQVQDLAKLFASEQSRLDFVKNAYKRITDPKNFAALLENFLISGLQGEFKKFLDGKK